MKTDQLMKIAFPKGTIDIFHKSQMGSLKDVFKLGNKYLVENDEDVVRLDNFLKRTSTKRYIENMMKKYGYDKNHIIRAVGKGRGAVTYGNIQFIIYCATEINDFFRMDVIDVFINEKILTKRDDGGDDFKELNFHLDNLPDRQGKNNKGMFIQVAMRLRSKIFKPEQIKECKDRNINIWNSEYANVVTLSKREEYEKLLIKLIEMNFVNSYEDVKSAIDKL